MSKNYAGFFKVVAWLYLIGFIIVGLVTASAGLSYSPLGGSAFVTTVILFLGGGLGYITYSAISAAILQLIATHEKVEKLEEMLSALPERVAQRISAQSELPKASAQRQEGQVMGTALPGSGEGAAQEEAAQEKLVQVDRSIEETICPYCGTQQASNRNVCFKCGARFVTKGDGE